MARGATHGTDVVRIGVIGRAPLEAAAALNRVLNALISEAASPTASAMTTWTPDCHPLCFPAGHAATDGILAPYWGLAPDVLTSQPTAVQFGVDGILMANCGAAMPPAREEDAASILPSPVARGGEKHLGGDTHLEKLAKRCIAGGCPASAGRVLY